MIPVNEAILHLNTSGPTFYRRIKSVGVNTIIKKEPTGKRSYLKEEDFEKVRLAMWKPPLNWLGSENSSEPTVSQSNIDLAEKARELEKENTVLSTKVEEYQGHIKLYEQQITYHLAEKKQLNEERKTAYANLLSSQVELGRYKVMFYAVIISVGAIIVTIGLLLRLNVLQFG